MMRRLLLVLALIHGAPLVAGAAEYGESPVLAEKVGAGKLPTVAERLPGKPYVVRMDGDRKPGKYGGDLNVLMARSKDVRQMVVYGYARLVKYNPDFELIPDILEAIDVEEGRIFTLHLRKGHRWSDGAPFTTEDFRYWWENVANDEDLAPSGPPVDLRVNGEIPKVEFIDETTVRYSWQAPNPRFLPALARAGPLYIYRPAHYLKQYHAAYGDETALNEAAKARDQRNWASLHNKLDNQYKNDNIELPSLQPWINTTAPPSERFIFQRNPYFHRVDPEGRQLPYIDRVIMQIASSKIIPAKAGTGESDLQARYLRFDNFTFLRENQDRNGYKTLLWRIGKGSHMTLYPNLNAQDVEWHKLFRDVRVRRALSLAINRKEINQVIYFGLALESQNTVLPQSPLFKPEYQTAWTAFDLKQANTLLDEVGLTERDSSGLRLLPDGRPMELIVETAGESTEQTDVLELVRDSWKKIGIALHSKPSQREVVRNRIYAGETLVSIWEGLENGLPGPDTLPDELAPVHQEHYQWPKWGQHVETSGASGEPVDMDKPKELLALLDDWYAAGDRPAKAEIWHKMLSIWADQVFTIGIVSGTLQPVVVNAKLRNVPEKGMFTWEPGAHFGIYEPDSFWFDK